MERTVAHDWIITAAPREDAPLVVAVCKVCGLSRKAVVGQERLALGGGCDQERTDPEHAPGR